MREDQPTRGRAFFDVARQKKLAEARNAKQAEQQQNASNNNNQQLSEKMPAVCLRAMQGM